jgi:hypothetical protein
MNIVASRLAPSYDGVHPALLSRRLHDVLVGTFVVLVTVAAALAIVAAVPEPDPLLVLAIVLGAVGLLALLLSARYEVTLTLLALYLGLLDGPVKLLTASQAASGARNILTLAVVLGMVVRLTLSRERIRLPPLSGWVLAFVVVVLIEAVNPNTGGFLKIIGGFRQQLQWVPFFFFGYMILRSKQHFRKFFLLLGVLALVNGLVGAYQSRLSPHALGSWGTGYSERVEGTGGTSGRTYVAEGEARPRPPALGSDSGFGGAMGVLALPGLLALITTGRRRRRWIALLLCAGALVAIGTAASRTDVVVAAVAVIAYAGLSVIGGLGPARPLVVVIAAVALAAGVAWALIGVSGKGVLARQASVTRLVEGTGETNAKTGEFKQVPREIRGAPFGGGLGTVGAAAGFGGLQRPHIEGKGAGGAGTFNLLVIETGLPGLLLWVGLSINVLLLPLRRLRVIRDVELRTYLVAVLAAFVAFTAEEFVGPTLEVAPVGTFLWFGAGVAAYWLAGPGRRRAEAAGELGSA